MRPDEGYTAVVVVVFTEDLRVDHALRVPREVVNEHFPRRAHVNGRVIRLTRRLLDHPPSSDSTCRPPRSTPEREEPLLLLREPLEHRPVVVDPDVDRVLAPVEGVRVVAVCFVELAPFADQADIPQGD